MTEGSGGDVLFQALLTPDDLEAVRATNLSHGEQLCSDQPAVVVSSIKVVLKAASSKIVSTKID
jgi:hypothetical protein